MQTRELFINEKSLDLADATKIGVTLQANNLGELQNRQGEFTNVFKLPKTLRNRVILEHLDNISSVSLIPYRQNVARYLEDGVEVISEGTATVESTDENFYFLKVTSGNLEFFNKFPDVKVWELDWTNEIHTRNLTNIVNSRTNTSGYIYPLINWFNDDNTTAFNTNVVDARYLYPCMFLRDIIGKVDQVTGYTSKGSFIDWLQDNEVVLSPKDSKMNQTVSEGFKSSATNTVEELLGIGGGIGNPPVIITPIMDVITNDFVFNTTIEAPVTIYGYIKYKASVEVYSIRHPLGTRNATVNVRIVNANTGFVLFQQAYSTLVGTGLYTPQVATINFEFISINFDFVQGEQLKMELEIIDIAEFSGPNFDFVFSQFKLLKDSKLEFLPILENPFNTSVQFGNLFDLKIKDVYKDFMNWKGVMVQTNPLKKEVYFDFFETIENFLPYAKDWSEKVDTETIKTNYSFGKYGQLNNLKFKAHETITVGFNDASFKIDDTTLEDEVTVIQMVTAATESEIKFNGFEIPRIQSLNLNNKFIPTEHRLLILNRNEQAVRYNDGTTNTTVSNNPFCQGIQFDLENDYNILQQILYRSKVVKLRLKLNEVDLKKLQRYDLPTQQMGFLQTISLSIQTEKMNLNGYFYVNKIENIQGGFGTAELIKI